MEYRHILTQGEISTGRLNFGRKNLDPESSIWFEKHSGAYVAIYGSNSLLIKRSVVIDQYKRNSWRFNCGIRTFSKLQPGDILVIKDRSDGNLEVQIGQQPLEMLSPVS